MGDVQPQPVSRRRMLKRIGAGAAIAWSAPVLTSIRMPAFAQGYAKCSPEFCGPRFDFCGPNAVCPLPPTCGVGICSEMNDHSCLCWDFAFCTCPTPVCTTDADCGAGLKCGPTEPDCTPCCGRVACYHPCGTSGEAPRPRSGLKVRRAADVRR